MNPSEYSIGSWSGTIFDPDMRPFPISGRYPAVVIDSGSRKNNLGNIYHYVTVMLIECEQAGKRYDCAFPVNDPSPAIRGHAMIEIGALFDAVAIEPEGASSLELHGRLLEVDVYTWQAQSVITNYHPRHAKVTVTDTITHRRRVTVD